jgi:DNA-binding transcriptional LysR family regulator
MLIRRIADVRAHVREVAGAEAATIRIAATHALSLIFFPSWLKRLEAEGLICCVQLASDTLNAVETLLLDGRAHFVLCHVHEAVPLRLPASEFDSALVAHDRLIPCAAPGMMATGVASLMEAPLLAYGVSSGLGRILRGVIGARLPRLLAAPALTADLAGALRALCLDGRGVAWLPATLVEDDLEAGRLLPFTDASWEVPVAVRLFRPQMRLTPTAERMWLLAQRLVAEP